MNDVSFIVVSERSLENAAATLRHLRTQWSGVPSVPDDTFAESKGKSVTALQAYADETAEVSRAFGDLMDNTLQFFRSTSQRFANADDAAAKLMQDKNIM